MILKSKNFILNSVTTEDARFILELRTNKNLNKFLSPTNSSIEDQINWIKEYKNRELEGTEYYFKITDKEFNDIGFVRLYKIDKVNRICTFGSFILKEDRPKLAAIESMVAIIKFAFDDLNLDKVILDVRVKNEHAKNLYNRFGFIKTSENDLDEFYKLEKSQFEKLYNEQYYRFMEEKDESRIRKI